MGHDGSGPAWPYLDGAVPRPATGAAGGTPPPPGHLPRSAAAPARPKGTSRPPGGYAAAPVAMETPAPQPAAANCRPAPGPPRLSSAPPPPTAARPRRTSIFSPMQAAMSPPAALAAAPPPSPAAAAAAAVRARHYGRAPRPRPRQRCGAQREAPAPRATILKTRAVTQNEAAANVTTLNASSRGWGGGVDAHVYRVAGWQPEAFGPSAHALGEANGRPIKCRGWNTATRLLLECGWRSSTETMCGRAAWRNREWASEWVAGRGAGSCLLEPCASRVARARLRVCSHTKKPERGVPG